jgi:four helix bundle protein
MSTVKKFEDLECWQSARKLCKLVYKLTRKEKFSKDFSIVNQIRDSSGSVMDNIPEGFDRGGNKEFIQFLSISRGSLGEVKSQLYRALDQDYINEKEFQEAYDLSDITGKQITGLINYLKFSNKKGFKYL